MYRGGRVAARGRREGANFILQSLNHFQLYMKENNRDCEDGSVFNALRRLGNESVKTGERVLISQGKTNCAPCVPTEFRLNIPH